MILQSVIRAGLLAVIVALCGSCEKSSPAPTAPAVSQSASPLPLMRVYWTGKKRISADADAARVMEVWNLPESAKLQAQTLDKLSAAPWRFLRNETNAASTNLLRPLLEDVVNQESYFELRPPHDTNAEELIFAIHLDNQRAAVWETNIAAALESLTGIRLEPAQVSGSNSPTAARWSLRKHHAPNLIEMARAGDWTILGAAQDHNNLFDETIQRVQRGPAPFGAISSSGWLQIQADLPHMAHGIWGHPLNLPANVPAILLSLLGDNRHVRMLGQFNFTNHTALVLKPWLIPTNMISPTLSSFTIVRGLKAPLESQNFWRNLHIGEPPDQICTWAVQGIPSQTYFSAPMPDASNVVSKISDMVMKKDSRFAANPIFGFQKSKSGALEWHGLPYMSPFLEPTIAGGNSFITGGLMARSGMEGAPPAALLSQLQNPNLVAYGWELTGERLNEWIYMGQFIRLISQKPQLPTDAAALAWLRAAAPHLQFCGTELTQTAPGQLSINRSSTIGLTGIELNLFADWLESPEFPFGLHTLLTEPSGSARP
jgi:hypothetical protein